MLKILNSYDVLNVVDGYDLVPVYTIELGGFTLTLSQYKAAPGMFAMQYGKQLDYRLSYATAAKHLGAAIMHASVLAGTLRSDD